MNNSPLVTISKFANDTGLSLSCVTKWVARGKIPSIKIGKRRLIRLKDFLDNSQLYTKNER